MTIEMDRRQIKNILVISLSNLGDVILTTPVLAALREHFPDASLAVLAGPKAEAFFEGCRTVNRVILYDKRRMSLMDKIRLIGVLRKMNFDLAIDLRNTLIPYLIGTPHKNGFAIGKQPVAMRARHLSRLKFLGLLEPTAAFDFFSEEERQRSQEKLKKSGIQTENGWIVMAPGAGSYLKRWGIKRFSEAAKHFSNQGKQVVVLGSAEERNLGEKIENGGSIVNLCGTLSLREAAAVLKEAELVLCCDSALMHLANEQNVPVVAIFGPTDEKKYARFGSSSRVVRIPLECAPCERAHCRFEHQYCMEDLFVNEVVKTCEELLSVNAH